ncbi:MAG: quinone oxidoreductase [Burkholderiaceae bacterium]
MSKAIRIEQTGGPEAMRLVEHDPGAPAAGELRIRNHAVGVNFIDVYFRTGAYPMPLPGGIGMEGAGVVEALGDGVTGFAPGDRVAYAAGPPGAYAEVHNLAAKSVVALPDAVDFESAAALMLKGMTVQYLFNRTAALRPGQTILFHAAAGGVGLIAMQWARAMGVRVIGTAGSEEKAELARRHGCEHVILYRSEDIVERVREITDGAMVPVVYDSIGKDTFDASLDSLAPFGTMVSFGAASGPVPPVPLTALRGTLYLTRPSVLAYSQRREDLEAMANGLFEMVADGKVRPVIEKRMPLAEAAQAHRELEARRTTGATLLLP